MNLLLALKDKKTRSIINKSWEISSGMTTIMFFVFLMGLTDVYVAGRIGKNVQAAYGIAFQIYFIFSIIANALSIGVVSVVSRLFTSERKEDLYAAIDSSLTVTALTGIIFALLGILLSGWLVDVMNIPYELKGVTVVLLRIYSIGLVFNYLILNTNAILRAAGLIRDSIRTMSLVCVLNVALNFILAFMTPLGFKGIAFATVFSTLLGSVLNIFFCRRIIKGRFTFSFPLVKNIIYIGWPAGLLQVLWQLSVMALFLVLSALPRHNIEIIAAFTNGLKIESAIFLPAFAFNMGCAVLVGNLLGKKETDDTFNAGVITASIGVFIVTILTLIVMINAKLIAAALSNNEIVIRESVRYIYISLISEPFMAWGVILAGALNGAGDTKGVLCIVALSVWLVRIPLSYILAIYFGLGAPFVWWSMNISILVQAIFISRRYFAKKWIAQAA